MISVSIGFRIGMLNTTRWLRQNATKGQKGGSKQYILPNFDKNRGRNTTFSPFLLKYRGRNYERPEKKGGGGGGVAVHETSSHDQFAHKLVALTFHCNFK